jgi:hypothetical protein
MKSLALVLVDFKRTEKSNWEGGWGLSKVGDASDLIYILDSSYKRLTKRPWDFRTAISAKAEIIPGGIVLFLKD